MTQAPDVPQYMQRVVLDPIPELSAIRDSVRVQKIATPLGLPAYLVTRYDDVKAALADPERFSNADFRVDDSGQSPAAGAGG
jgi:hypothetical protein